MMAQSSQLAEGSGNLVFDEDQERKMSLPETEGKESDTTLNDFPDDLLQICLARVPLRYVPTVKVVCKRWYELGDTPYLYQLRKNLGLTEPWTYILANEYVKGCYKALQGRANDSSSHGCRLIAPLNAPQRLQFAAAASGDGLLYILGGRSPLVSRRPEAWVVFSRVDVYDPICNSWYQVQSMKTARFGFAAGSFIDHESNQPKLIVAGGYNACGLALSNAEIYHPCNDEWEPIASMRIVSGACRGESYKGKFYVKQANNGPEAIEVFDPSLRSWSTSFSTEVVKQCFQGSGRVCNGGNIILDL